MVNAMNRMVFVKLRREIWEGKKNDTVQSLLSFFIKLS